MEELIDTLIGKQGSLSDVQRLCNELAQLREQNRVLRSNLVNCAARLEAYYGEDYPAVRDAKNALTATSRPAKSAGKMHACDVPGCVSCGNPEDATSQERSANKEG